MEAPPSLMQRRHEVWGAGDRALLKVPQQLQLSWLLHGLVQRSEINPLLPMPPWLCGEQACRRVLASSPCEFCFWNEQLFRGA